MTLAEILALPAVANPRLIQASDTGDYYAIEGFSAGNTATSIVQLDGVVTSVGNTTSIADGALSFTKISNLSSAILSAGSVGVVFTDASPVVNGDTIRVVIGKLQAQSTANQIALSGKVSTTATENISGAKTFYGQTQIIGQSAIDTNSVLTKGLGVNLIANATSVSTGITYFEGLFINANPQLFDRGEVRGWILTQETLSSAPVITQYTFPRVNGITAPFRTTNAVTLLSIDSTGTLIQQVSAFSVDQRRTTFLLGQITHVDFATITKAAARPNILTSVANRFEIFCAALGAFNISGNIFSNVGVLLQMQKSAGTIFSASGNYQTLPNDPDTTSLVALNPCIIQHVTRNTVTSIDTNIDPNNYDNGGVLTAVSNNKFTVQPIYLFQDNNLAVGYGQMEYSTFALARAAASTEHPVLLASVRTFGILRGWLVVKQGTTSLSTAIAGGDAEFIEAGKFVSL